MGVRYLQDYRTPMEYSIERVSVGENTNHEGYYLRGLTTGDRWVYRNEFAPARLADDEIAIATCLMKMRDYIQGGAAFYSLAEASQDHYLQLMVRRAVTTGETVRTTPQIWATEQG